MGSIGAIKASEAYLAQVSPGPSAEETQKDASSSVADDTPAQQTTLPSSSPLSWKTTVSAYVLAQDIVTQADANHDGVLSRREFIAAYGTTSAFADLDKNGDGRVSVGELAQDILGVDA